MLMGGAGQETPVQTISITQPPEPECPYGAGDCPKIDELKTELDAIRKENNVIWKELNKVDKTVSGISASISSLKWLVFVLVCGATGVGIYL